MEAIGEFLEPLTTNLYPWRIQIAIGSVLVVLALAVIGWRRGWLAAARRHPARAGMLALAAVLVGAPLGWYLGSPIFLRSSLVEAAPTAPPATEAPTLGPSLGPSGTPEATSTPGPSPTPTPHVPVTLAVGEFQGTDDFHFGRGTASIIEVEPGRYHLRLDDFSVRNGPDLFVYLSQDPTGYVDEAVELGRLKATDGAFGYDLPEGLDPAEFASALIWCKQFAHLFAYATFEA